MPGCFSLYSLVVPTNSPYISGCLAKLLPLSSKRPIFPYLGKSCTFVCHTHFEKSVQVNLLQSWLSEFLLRVLFTPSYCPSHCLDYCFSTLKASTKVEDRIHFGYAWATAALILPICIIKLCGLHTHALSFYFLSLFSCIRVPLNFYCLHLIIAITLSREVSIS